MQRPQHPTTSPRSTSPRSRLARHLRGHALAGHFGPLMGAPLCQFAPFGPYANRRRLHSNREVVPSLQTSLRESSQPWHAAISISGLVSAPGEPTRR